MINCPHCNQPVDEQTNFYCPSCRKPLRSLSGELLTPPTTPTQSPSTSGPAPTNLPGPTVTQPAPNLPPTRPTMAPTAYRLQNEQEKESKVARYVIAFCLLVFIAVLGAGGYIWWMHTHSNPEDTAKRFVEAISNEDMETLYNLSILPDNVKAKYPDAKSFADNFKRERAAMNSTGTGQVIDMFFKLFKGAKVGHATINGDTATVPITLHITFGPLSTDSQQNLPMRYDHGMWKVDMSAMPVPTSPLPAGNSAPGGLLGVGGGM
jgi:hypothetical protein